MNNESMEKNRYQAKVEQYVKASRIPLRTRKTRRLNKIARTENNCIAVDAAESFISGNINPPILLIIGVPGVGKTTLTYAVAWEFIEDALSVRYWQVEELLIELMASQNNGERYGEIWHQAKICDLLILDDIGAHNPTIWRNSQLDALIDFRYREGAPMILTANNVEFTERITDRIKEGKTVNITGKSWRGREDALL
jgi:DNA replication protein DnaC